MLFDFEIVGSHGLTFFYINDRESPAHLLIRTSKKVVAVLIIRSLAINNRTHLDEHKAILGRQRKFNIIRIMLV